MGFGLYLLLSGGDGINGLWLVVLGWFLGQAAARRGRAEPLHRPPGGRHRGRPHGPPAGLDPGRRVGHPGPGRVLRPLPLALVPGGRRHRPASSAALLRSDAVDAAVAAGRPLSEAGELAEGGDDAAIAVRTDTPVEHLLGAPGLRQRGALMVLDPDGRLCGVVTVEQVQRALTAAAPGRAL